ncbi:hypothetical protein [Ornithinimicrobium kibberense]|uniref:hypothetical protein n=1 Tax=Ornithinimicrobium kibberense TaxID=282060 RepID=UPI0036245672
MTHGQVEEEQPLHRTRTVDVRPPPVGGHRPDEQPHPQTEHPDQHQAPPVLPRREPVGRPPRREVRRSAVGDRPGVRHHPGRGRRCRSVGHGADSRSPGTGPSSVHRRYYPLPKSGSPDPARSRWSAPVPTNDRCRCPLPRPRLEP